MHELAELLASGVEDESRLADLVISIGADTDGLRNLLERYGRTHDERVLGYVALALSRSAWRAKPEDSEALKSIVLDLAVAVSGMLHSGTLISIVNSVQGLHASGFLHSVGSDAVARLAALFAQCIESADSSVQVAALDVLGHLWSDGALRGLLLGPSYESLRASLAELAAKAPGDDLGRDLESLRGFW